MFFAELPDLSEHMPNLELLNIGHNHLEDLTWKQAKALKTLCMEANGNAPCTVVVVDGHRCCGLLSDYLLRSTGRNQRAISRYDFIDWSRSQNESNFFCTRGYFEFN